MQLAAIFFCAFFALAAQAQSREIRILPLGDSITYGIGDSCDYERGDCGGYRTWLYASLSARRVNFRFVGGVKSGPLELPQKQNEGHPGWRIDEIAAPLDGWLKSARADIILLHIGTNDFEQEFDLKRVNDRLDALLNRILKCSPRAQLFVASIIPIYNKPELSAQVDRYNLRLKRSVQRLARQGRSIFFVDMARALSGSDYVSDGIHPNVTGYKKMASMWAGALSGF